MNFRDSDASRFSGRVFDKNIEMRRVLSGLRVFIATFNDSISNAEVTQTTREDDKNHFTENHSKDVFLN